MDASTDFECLCQNLEEMLDPRDRRAVSDRRVEGWVPAPFVGDE